MAGKGPSSRDWPLVSAILIFGDQQRAERRVTLARRAVNQFVRQIYPNKQLIVANATDLAITTRPHAAIKEIQVMPGALGYLRNQALAAAAGAWIMPVWDDDDVYDPFLIDYLMQHAVPDRAVAMNTQARVHIYKMTAYFHYEEAGIANTMIVPRSEALFSTGLDHGEDGHFWRGHWQHRSVVIDTRVFPLNLLKVCTYHRHNAVPEDLFMVGHTAAAHTGKLYLNDEERERLAYLLAPFGVGIGQKEPEGEPSVA